MDSKRERESERHFSSHPELFPFKIEKMYRLPVRGIKEDVMSAKKEKRKKIERKRDRETESERKRDRERESERETERERKRDRE